MGTGDVVIDRIYARDDRLRLKPWNQMVAVGCNGDSIEKFLVGFLVLMSDDITNRIQNAFCCFRRQVPDVPQPLEICSRACGKGGRVPGDALEIMKQFT